MMNNFFYFLFFILFPISSFGVKSKCEQNFRKQRAQSVKQNKEHFRKIIKRIDDTFPKIKQYGVKNPFETENGSSVFSYKDLISKEEMASIITSSSFSESSKIAKDKFLKSLTIYINEYYSQWFLYPSESQLMASLKAPVDNFLSLLRPLGYSNYSSLIEDIGLHSPRLKENLRTFMAHVYIKTIEAIRKEKDISYHSPGIHELRKFINDSSNFEVEISAKTLQILLGNKKPHYEQDRLFSKNSGLLEIKDRAKFIKPNIFINFSDNDVLLAQANEFVKKLSDPRYKGFIVSSVTSRVPLNDSFFTTLVKMAKQKNLLLVLLAVNRETELLPEIKEVSKDGTTVYHSVLQKSKGEADFFKKDPNIKKLSELEDVFVIAHDIELSPFFTISSLPLMARNFSPFASLDRIRDKNKVSIFGHPQLQAKVEATDGNQAFPTVLLSTGSISERVYPSSTHASARLSALASHVHDAGAWLFEKPDLDAGTNKSVAPGQYHFSPIYYGDVELKGKGENIEGIVSNNGEIFLSDGRVLPAELEHIVFGDMHIGSTNPKMYEILKQIFKDYPSAKSLILHDHFDGYSINHHEKGRLSSDVEKIKEKITLKSEHEKNVQVINNILTMNPNIIISLVVSNHPNWLHKMLDDPKAYQDPANSTFLIEIKAALNQYSDLTPFEYLYNFRKTFHESHPIYKVSKEMKEQEVYIIDPKRVKVLKAGEPFYGGTASNRIKLDGHGHDVKGGRVGIGPSNASTIGSAVVGHTHAPGITRRIVNVGTATDVSPPYTKENMISNWVNAFALLFKGTGNPILDIVLSNIGNYRPLTDKRNSSHSELFGGKNHPIIRLTDNELASKDSSITSQHNDSDGKPIRRAKD